MVRQIRQLMRPVRFGETQTLAVAVYRVRRNGRWCCTPARESGYEGVACVDDVARAAWLFLEVYERYRIGVAREYAEGFLAFVRALQQSDGRFTNFVRNWRGRPNLSGTTSYPGGSAWTARAAMALARSAAVLGSEEDLECLRRAWPHIQEPEEYPTIRALHVLAALELEQATGEETWLRDVRAWSEEIMACRGAQGEFLNRREAPGFHLWGHIQPAALALAGARLQIPPFVEAAEASVQAYLEPIVRGGFALPVVLPYNVSSVIRNLKVLHQVTLRDQYRDLLHLARAWFRGRNTAGVPVYDPQLGLCHDGIDHGRLNTNSGAESNIEAAFALMDELPWEPLLASHPRPVLDGTAIYTAERPPAAGTSEGG